MKPDLLEEGKFTLNSANAVIQNCVNILLRKKLLKPEPYRFFLKKDFDTASWSYRPPHYLIFGFDIFKIFDLNEEQKIEFFKAFVFHELAHSIYTDYRIAKCIRILDERDLPFNVFNLFEDARIEFLLSKNLHIKFNWTKYMNSFDPYDPLELFYWCVENENNKEKFDKKCKRVNPTLRDKSSRVWSFYQKCLKAKDTFEIIDIVEEWMKELKDDDSSTLPKLFYGEEHAFGLPDSVVCDIKGAYEVKTISMRELKENQSDKVHTIGKHTIENLYSIKQFTSTDLLSKTKQRDGFDKKILQEITREIEKIFVEDRRYTKTSVPSKKLNIRNILLKKPLAYKKRKSSNQQKKVLSVVLDLSGSMSGIIEEMLVLVEALNILAKKNIIRGNLILCISAAYEEAQYQTFKFPLKDNVLNHIISYEASEGIGYTLKNLAKLLKPSDAVLVFTDGIFADDPLDRNFFYKHGIDIYGVFLKSETDIHYDLDQYFDKSIVSDDLVEISRELVKMVKIS